VGTSLESNCGLTLHQVGTLRYMAPEILEGAVNLRECESSLKQIDVYALGLVLWEISHRCWELYPSQEAPPYRAPFEDETGPHVTLEQMKTLVCRHKVCCRSASAHRFSREFLFLKHL